MTRLEQIQERLDKAELNPSPHWNNNEEAVDLLLNAPEDIKWLLEEYNTAINLLQQVYDAGQDSEQHMDDVGKYLKEHRNAPEDIKWLLEEIKRLKGE